MAAVGPISTGAVCAAVPAVTGRKLEEVISDLCEAILSKASPEKMKPLVARCSLDAALLEVAAKGNAHAIKVLLEGGANPNAADGSGKTALHSAVRSKDTESVTLLLEKGAKPNLKDNTGWTPLHSAAVQRTAEIAKVLLEKGADPNVKNNIGETVLHSAIRSLRPDGVRVLLEKKADPNPTVLFGATPLHLLLRHSQEATLPTLQAYLNNFPKEVSIEKKTSLFEVLPNLLRSMNPLEKSPAVEAIVSFIRKHDLPESPEFLERMRKLDSSLFGPLKRAFAWNRNKGLLMWRHAIGEAASKTGDEMRMKARLNVLRQNPVKDVKKEGTGCICS